MNLALQYLTQDVLMMGEQMKNELLLTQDGSHSLISKEFGVSYHSKYGAIQESMHVFIKAGLHFALQEKEGPINILEFGFGTGLNTLLSMMASEKVDREIFYHGIEAYPIELEVAESLNFVNLLGKQATAFMELHKSSWEEVHQLSPNFSFQKTKARFEDCKLPASFDVCFFDAFAPTAQPELWEPKVLKIAYDALRPKGNFVTYCAKGVVKRNLKSLGFKIEALPGPPGKREMTRGIKL